MGSTNLSGTWIRTSGRLYCWGSDGLGQVGNVATNFTEPTPVPVAGAASTWRSVSTGEYHSCGRRPTGRLFCWGRDSNGQLGDGGTNTDRPAPYPVAGLTTTWTSVTGGANHTCAVRSTGRLFCWGADTTGQLGDGGTNTERHAPVLVAGGITDWTSVSAGGTHTCARRGTGRLYCWGDDTYGGLGNGAPNTERHAPVEVAGGFATWTSVAGGAYQTCARRSSGRLYCWGSDSNDELGDGPGTTDQPAPVRVG